MFKLARNLERNIQYNGKIGIENSQTFTYPTLQYDCKRFQRLTQKAVTYNEGSLQISWEEQNVSKTARYLYVHFVPFFYSCFCNLSHIPVLWKLVSNSNQMMEAGLLKLDLSSVLVCINCWICSCTFLLYKTNRNPDDVHNSDQSKVPWDLQFHGKGL